MKTFNRQDCFQACERLETVAFEQRTEHISDVFVLACSPLEMMVALAELVKVQSDNGPVLLTAVDLQLLRGKV